MFRMIPIVRRSFNDAVTTIDYFIAWRFMRRLGQATPEEIRNTYKILVSKPQREMNNACDVRTDLEDNIKKELR
jgi:hypothetical protein